MSKDINQLFEEFEYSIKSIHQLQKEFMDNQIEINKELHRRIYLLEEIERKFNEHVQRVND
jgi:hypothetical protein